MRLSWNEIRARAAAFAREWADAAYEKGETQSFYNDFFELFGVRRRSVARYEEHVRRLDNRDGYIDLFWPGVLLVEQKSAGRDLDAAREQAGGYFDALPERDRPRYLLLSDFQTFELLDLDAREEWRFTLAELPERIDLFGFVAGVQRRAFREQDPVNVEAAELVGALHDALEDAGYAGDDLGRFLVRTVFCLFADNTGIFERDGFLNLIEDRSSLDGLNLGGLLSELFQVLNTPEDRRQASLDEDLRAFPYVNGDLFDGPLRIPAFTAPMRELLLDACRFDWSNISPAIFGSLFQSVMEADERRRQGAHYTSERNILKVIEPLFLDGLRDEFERLRARRDSRRGAMLEAFHRRLGELTFLDPACGCGNFLIIAYRELRALEIEVLRELRPYRTGGGTAAFDVASLTRVNVDQFHGIEINRFPARIAETALWMMDHIMNNRLSLEFGEAYARIPLTTSPRILNADALETDWAALLPPERCSYVLGNPPFGGFVLRDPRQQRSTSEIVRALGASGSRLDYVAAWFLKAGAYLQGHPARIGFVATNSLTQGEQVAQLWPALFDRYGLEISFAHTTFVWDSEARGKAHVYVVIIGMADRASAPNRRRLFVYDASSENVLESSVTAISPYLIDAGSLTNSHIVIHRQRSRSDSLPAIRVGTKPVDGGRYLFNSEERTAFLDNEPNAASLLRPFLGSAEFISGKERWILHVSGESPATLRGMPAVMERIHAVAHFRTHEAGSLGRQLADAPTEYHVTLVPEREFLVIPETSSSQRAYVPIGWLSPPTIPSNTLLVIENATLWQFAILTSAMHMAWLRYTGGRLGNGYRYSSVVYNTFPLPPVEEDALGELEPLARAVLDARAAHPGSTLADLYDADVMPANLRRAHQALDRAVDRLYRRAGFASERERVEHLLGLYERRAAPLTTDAKRRRRAPRSRG